MATYEQTYIAFRSYIDTKGSPPFEIGQIEDWAQGYKDFAHPELDANTLIKIIGELKEQFTVTQMFGGGITDNTYEPWWQSFRLDQNELHYWDRLNRYLKANEDLPLSVVNRLDGITDNIVDLIGNPQKEGVWNRRGMVIGHVQSGKTLNYSAVIAKAADAGFKVIVLLAGITNSLRRQTQDRINESFIGRRASRNQQLMSQRIGVGIGPHDLKVPFAGTFLEGDFSITALQTAVGFNLQSLNEPIIFVCKKNVSTLKNLLEYFDATDSENNLNLPLLLIDDEADNASINTKAEKKEITAINSGIRGILRKFHRSSYVGYTATPFANIFIDPEDSVDFGSDDLFPANYIRTLEAPSNYMGANKIFGENAEFFDRMIVPIDDYEQLLPLKHKNHWPVDELPNSLRRAVIQFIIAKTVRVLRGDGKKHCTMMVNVSRFNSVQSEVEGLLADLVESIRNDIRLNANASRPSSSSIIHEFEDEYLNEFCEKIDDDYYTYPAWSEVKSELFKGWSVQVKTVNMTGGALDYEAHKEEGLTLIAIGGLALSRGLTLEGLCITYILRNAAAYDTLMQMGRWFGYRPNYEDLCRLYLHEEAIEHYQGTSEAINELRAEVDFMATENLTPTQFGLKVRQSPFALRITAANKMRTSTTLSLDIGYRGKTLSGHTVFLDDKINDLNLGTTSKLLKSLGDAVNSADSPVQNNTWLWEGVNVDKILTFLDNFKLPPGCVGLAPIANRSLVSEFVDAKRQELRNWNVHVNNVLETDPEKDSDNGFLSLKIFNGKEISLRKRTGVKLVENKYYKINAQRTVGTGGDARAGLSKSEYEKLIEANADAENKDYKESASFKPTLVIYFIKPHVNKEESLPFTDGLVSFTIHFPLQGRLETAPKTYQVNMVYKQQEFDFDDGNDADEARQILAQEV